MKRWMIPMLVIALLACMPSWAAGSALDAFHALLEEPGEAPEPVGDALLDGVMAGQYASDADRQSLADAEDALSAIESRDIAAYASAHGLPVGQVRNAWYRALANALAARIELDPEADAQSQNAQAVLALFLSPDGDDAERGEIRGQMTPELSRSIADQTDLPEDFVSFVVMNEDWNDDAWENDDDWRQAAGWLEGEDIAVGSRDEAGATRIADLQSLLISLGYLKGKADGVFGPRTQAALIEFQLANGLPGSGVYDAASLARAQSASAVARWDYGEDFWDSQDFDTPDAKDTPDVRDTPDKKDTPDAKDTPDVKDTPDKKDTPDAKDTPDRKSPSEKKPSSKKRDTPDTPDTPDSPD